MNTQRLPLRIKVFLWAVTVISIAWLALWSYTGYFRAHVSVSGGFTLPLILVMVVPVVILADMCWHIISAARAGSSKRTRLSIAVILLTLVAMAVILYTPVLDRFLYG